MSSQAERFSGASTKGEKGPQTCKRGTLEVTEGGILQMSSTELVKCSVFRGQETLYAGDTFPGSVFHWPETLSAGGSKV